MRFLSKTLSLKILIPVAIVIIAGFGYGAYRYHLLSLSLIETKSILAARKLLRATIIYLPILLLLIVIDINF